MVTIQLISSGEIALCLDFHVLPPGGQAVNRIRPKLKLSGVPKVLTGMKWSRDQVLTCSYVREFTY
jgi:hypothetical protein